MSLLQYSIEKLYKIFLCESLRTMNKTSFHLFDHRRRKPTKNEFALQIVSAHWVLPFANMKLIDKKKQGPTFKMRGIFEYWRN